MKEKNPLRGQERRVISTKLYRIEFANFIKICEAENKKINAKLREMILKEIKRYPSQDIFVKIKEDKERRYNSFQSKKKQWNFEIKGENKNV